MVQYRAPEEIKQPWRQVFGAKNGASKLTPEIVLEARRLHREEGVGFHTLARKYGVDRKTIKPAVLGITWRHIP